MKVKKISLAVISDIHLGSTLNSASEIIANLRSAVGDNTDTAQLDILFLAGDVFDELLVLSNDDVVEIDLWIFNLLSICAKHGIMVRVLEGTPRHDRKQSVRFDVVNEVMGFPVDLKYVKTVSIEHIEKFGIDVLYIPDEANPTPEKTLKDIRALMKARSIEQVDLAIMHGMFEHQVPEISLDHKHNSAEYLALVRYLIFIGHVHTYSQRERIFAQGSFDRIGHGQEEDKGHIRAIIYDSGEWESTFVVNRGAKRFVTIDCRNMDVESTLQEINDRVLALPRNAHVRLVLEKGHPLHASADVLIRTYPMITWKTKIKGSEKEFEETQDALEDDDSFIPITITRDNLVEMVMARASLRDNMTSELLDVVLTQLKEVVQ